jgi:hypothetical protein
MYGFSGYATNTYASRRNAFRPPVISLPMVILQLKFKGITVEL